MKNTASLIVIAIVILSCCVLDANGCDNQAVGDTRLTSLDRLLEKSVFKCNPIQFKVEGKLSNKSTSATYLPDNIIGNIDNNGNVVNNSYDYFMIRKSKFPEVYKFDIIYFNKNGNGVATSMLSRLFTNFSDVSMVYSERYRGGGSDGTIKGTKTMTFSIARSDIGSDDLKVLVLDNSVFWSIWTLTHRERVSVTMLFEPVELSKELLDKAYSIPINNPPEPR
jgi:hypothetical protein